jgi:hypothetical protein
MFPSLEGNMNDLRKTVPHERGIALTAWLKPISKEE